MRVAVVKYNAGKCRIGEKRAQSFGRRADFNRRYGNFATADKVIFPGVGEASSAMNYLRERNLDETIKSLSQPVLGICLGMQLLCESSEENETKCLGILPYRVRKFESDVLKIPQMGWNNIFNLKSNLLNDVAENSFVYFVHSFYVESGTETIATCDYGLNFSAAIQHKNFYAVQFHAEKSARSAQRL
jgi:glutamine amidotransferase